MLTEKLLERLIESFHKFFPNGFCTISTGCLGGLTIRIGLIKLSDDCSSRIRENDPMFSAFGISLRSDPRIAIMRWNGSAIAIKSTNPRYAMEFKKVQFREIMANNEDQAVYLWERYLARLKTEAQKIINEGRLYGQEEIKSEYLTF